MKQCPRCQIWHKDSELKCSRGEQLSGKNELPASVTLAEASVKTQFANLSTEQQIEQLHRRLTAYEQRLQALPKSDIISPRFWTRVWAIFGHQFMAGLAIYAVIFGLWLVFLVLAGITGM